MMYQKALLCKQYEIAEKILDAENAAEAKNLASGKNMPMSSEQLKIWDKISYQVVKRGLRAKFDQNKDILEILLETGTSLLAEASPKDTKWGIGFGPDDDRAKECSHWKGKNYLGRILMEIREEFSVLYQGERCYREWHETQDNCNLKNYSAAVLYQIPQYHEAIQTYLEIIRLYAAPAYDGFLKLQLYKVDEMMATNMGGGLPAIGYREMRQDLSDISTRLNRNN